MFGWEFPPFISGGLGTACYGMTRHLAESGEEVLFVLPKAMEGMPRDGYQMMSAEEVWKKRGENDFPLPELVTVLTVETALYPYIENREYARMIRRFEGSIPAEGKPAPSIMSMSGHYSHNLFEEVQRFAEVGWHLAEQSEFDVIHAHDWMTFPAAMAAKKRSGKPLIAHIHATEYDRTGDHPNQKIAHLEKIGMEHADRVVAVSHRTKQQLVERYHVDAGKIDVVHNAVSHDKLVDPLTIKKSFKEKLIIFVGRVTLQKGPEYFLRAAVKVLETHPNYRFVMCGAGDMLPRMIEESAALRIQNRFHFTGFLRGAAVDRLYSMADLFVMTSVSEPFGLTPFEAMRYDVPVIVSRQAGASELLPNSMQVDFWDRDKLATMMIEFCENKELHQHLLEHQKKTLSKMSWRTVAEQLKTIYRKVIHV
jgi:glycosyltransferase involved in cell wall biosynthesis